MIKVILCAFVVMGFSSYSSAESEIFPVIPDPDLTPGELCDTKDSDFTEYRYAERIPYCKRGVTRDRKTQIYLTYNVPLTKRGQYTIDHFIPLSIGGDNSDENLWPEHKKIKQLRRNLELRVYEAVRDGEMKQSEAIEVIVDAKLNPPIEVSAFEGVLY